MNETPATSKEHLALCGDDELVASVQQRIADESKQGPAVLLPTGAAYERPDKLADRARELVHTAGGTLEIVDVLDRSRANDPERADTIRAAGCVWIAGASALHIRATLKDTLALDALRSVLTSGGFVVGSAGGATCLADPMVDSRGGAFTLGLGLVRDLTIVSGAERQTPEHLRRSVELASSGVLFVHLPLASALLHESGTWQCVGDVVAWRSGVNVTDHLVDELPAVAAAASADSP